MGHSSLVASSGTKVNSSSSVLSARTVWELVLLLTQLYNVITVPFRCCFLHDFGFKAKYAPLIIGDFVYVGLNLLELILRVRFSDSHSRIQSISSLTGIDFSLGFMEATRMRAPKKYWAESAWFYLDAVAIFPFELLGSNRFLYLIRLVGQYHVSQYTGLIFAMLEEKQILSNIGLQRMWTFFVAMAISGHLCGCAFYAASVHDAWAGESSTWGQLDGLWVQSNGTLDYRQELMVRYLRSIYWAYVTMVTTGFGDIVPVTTNETIVCIFSMYVGLVITGTAIANLTLVVTNLDAAATEYQQKLDNLANYMRYRNIPYTLSAKIRRFYEYMWQSLKGVDEKEFLRNLPRPLQQRVTGLITKDLLLRVPSIRRVDPIVLLSMLDELEKHIYSPGDCISKKNECYSGVMLLARGEAEVLSNDSTTVVRTIAKTENFGFEALFDDFPAPGTICAKTYCEVYQLPKEKFRSIVFDSS